MSRKSSGSRSTEYLTSIKNLDNYGETLQGLLKSLLGSAGINHHSINYRVKEKESAEKKIGLKPDRYTDFRSLTDLLGVRIITYFNDEVDKVGQLLEREFKIDKANSIDKRLSLEPDRFGYLSLHYILELNNSRSNLVEYAPYRGIKFEVQIRSILQHAWAEIEHDLGYKAKSILPKEIRRRFFRVAGLLEIADDEFGALRDQISAYEHKVAQQISGPLFNLPLDSTTVDAYIHSSKVVEQLDFTVSTLTNPPGHIVDVDDIGSEYARLLQNLGFSNMGEVDEALKANSDEIIGFAKFFHTSDDSDSDSEILPIGVSIYLYYYLQAAQANQESRINMIKFSSQSDAGAEHIISMIEDSWRRMTARG